MDFIKETANKRNRFVDYLAYSALAFSISACGMQNYSNLKREEPQVIQEIAKPAQQQPKIPVKKPKEESKSIESCIYAHINIDLTAKLDTRESIKSQVDSQYPVYAFGKFLDDAVDFANRLKSEKESYTNNIEFMLEVPKNLFEKEMDLSIEINKKDRKLRYYQTYNGEKWLLLTTNVTLGKKSMPTPSGLFYLNRVVNSPWWYPPKWSKQKEPSKPGENNPDGLWMSELIEGCYLANYSFNCVGDSSIKMHSTNEPDKDGFFSHGCIRVVKPKIAEAIFRSILFYIPHLNPKTNSRGTIYPLLKAIPIKIE